MIFKYNRIRVLCFSVLSVFTCYLSANENVDQPINKLISTSVIIPCHSAHLQFLPGLLDALETQSYVPDEVVISISSIKDGDDLVITQLEQNKYSFALKILRSLEHQFAGENRNIAIANSTGELIICQDADDFPHRQRVEAIKNAFQETRFDFLCHLHILAAPEPLVDEWILYNTLKFPLNGYELMPISSSTDMFDKPPEFFMRFIPEEIPISRVGIHIGNCAFRREVFDEIQYNDKPSGQDFDFFSKVICTFKNNLVMNLPLVNYFTSRSTINLRNSSSQETTPDPSGNEELIF